MYFVLVKNLPTGASLSFLAYTFSDSFCVDYRVVAFQHFGVGAKLVLDGAIEHHHLWLGVLTKEFVVPLKVKHKNQKN